MPSGKQMVSRHRSGVSVLLVSFMSIVIFPMVGLSIDVGILYLVRTKLSAAVDAAALAGARALRRGGDTGTQAANAQTTAHNYFYSNFPNGYLSKNTSITTTVIQLNTNVRQVQSMASADVPVAFLRILPSVGPTVTVTASATSQRRDTNVILVLDRSGSLTVSGSCSPMKAAAAGFVDMFAEQRDYVGVVTFATSSYYLDYPPASNFKSATPSAAQVINQIDCLGGTSSAMGLWNGYSALANLNLPGALNVIVFFTDGQPTALTAQFPIKATSPCAYNRPPYPPNTPKLGVLTVGFSGGVPITPFGLFKLSNGPVPIAQDNVVQTGDSSCSFASISPTTVATDIQYVPDQDYYGNRTNTGYQPVTTDASGHVTADPTSVMNASVNAADQAAYRIRNGQPIANGNTMANVVIFSVGLGNATDAPPNADFLKRVANDPGSSTFDSSKPTGLYVFAQTANDLNDAFQRVASEILRLTK